MSAEPAGTPAPLIDLILAELRASASEAQVDAFLAAVGARIAADAPVASGPLDTVAAAINRVWAVLGLGEARLTLGDDAILVDHRRGAGGSRPLAALAPLLRGTYEGWFRSFGGGDGLRTTIVHGGADRVELRHGL
jgi:hypothetical protein